MAAGNSRSSRWNFGIICIVVHAWELGRLDERLPECENITWLAAEKDYCHLQFAFFSKFVHEKHGIWSLEENKARLHAKCHREGLKTAIFANYWYWRWGPLLPLLKRTHFRECCCHSPYSVSLFSSWPGCY